MRSLSKACGLVVLSLWSGACSSDGEQGAAPGADGSAANGGGGNSGGGGAGRGTGGRATGGGAGGRATGGGAGNSGSPSSGGVAAGGSGGVDASTGNGGALTAGGAGGADASASTGGTLNAGGAGGVNSGGAGGSGTGGVSTGGADAGSADAGCSPSLDTDPENCGACGRNCLGGTCTNGLCDPIVLARDVFWVRGIAIDANNVYFTTTGVEGGTDGTVQQIAKSGGDAGSPVSVASAQHDCSGIAVEAGTVYWASTDGVRKAPVGGGQAVDLAPGEFGMDLLLHGTDVFFTTGGAVKRTTKAAGGGVATVVSNLMNPNSLAVHVASSTLFFVNYTAPGAVMSAPLGAQNATPDVIADADFAGGLAVDDSGAYFTISFGTELRMSSLVGKPDGGSTVLVPSTPSPRGIVLDGTTLYWVSDSGGVFKMPRSGGPVTTVAQGPVGAVRLSVDSTHVYWVTRSATGRVLKVAK